MITRIEIVEIDGPHFRGSRGNDRQETGRALILYIIAVFFGINIGPFLPADG
jgi:hypothetical protein